MSVRIGHASIDENGHITGGKLGDQTGKEICIRTWYNKGWDYYIECIDDELAEKAADIMEEICCDKNFGYDQNQRLTGYNAIVKNKKKVKGAKGEFDCSSLVAACYKLAGLDVSQSCTTRNLRKALLATGKFKAYSSTEYAWSENYAKRGGIYLKEGSHVVMALNDGKKVAKAANTSNATTSVQYFKKCTYTGSSITEALKSIGAESSKAYRTKIAKANGITNYTGTYEQNVKLLKLLKQGKLIKP